MKAMTSRRAFLKGLSAASFFAGGGCASILSSRSPNSQLCHACIGTANMARYDMEQFLANPRVKVTALCDVDASFLAAARKLVPDARIYRDWRELLTSEGDRIDFLCDYYSYEGEYLDSYMLGDPYVYGGQPEISNVYVDEDAALATYRFVDIYQQEYWTEVLP